MAIDNHEYEIPNRLKINLFTPTPFASLKLRESEEGE